MSVNKNNHDYGDGDDDDDDNDNHNSNNDGSDIARLQGLQSTSQAAPAKYPRHALESFTHRESDLPKSFGKAKP